MTVYQSQSNATVAYKKQVALGTQATGSGGTRLRSAGGTGISLTKAATESNEVRADGKRTRGRAGTQKTTGAWNAECSIGSHEAILEAVLRDTWDVSSLSVTEADMTSITNDANNIIAAAGSWVTKGLKVGDVVRLTNYSEATANGKNLRVTGVTTSNLTVAETLTVNAAPDSAFTLTRPKKLIQSGAALVKRYFTIDEYDADIDQSTVLTDFVWGQIKFTMAANGLLMADVSGAGTGQISALATGASPLLTSPTASVGVPLAVVDATIRIAGSDVVDLTNFDLTLDCTPSAPEVFGSGAIKYAPDVFTGQLGISLNMTALRKDLQRLTDFIAETPYAVHILAVENESEPKDFLSIYIGNLTLGSAQAAALSKAGGPRTQTITVPVALVGDDVSGSVYDQTMVKFQSTGV